MAVRTAGIWILGLSLAFAAIPTATLAIIRSEAGLQPIGAALVPLICAAVSAALGVIPTFIAVLWNGSQANGTEDRVGRLETRMYSIGAVVVAGLLLLIGAVTMAFIFPPALSAP